MVRGVRFSVLTLVLPFAVASLGAQTSPDVTPPAAAPANPIVAAPGPAVPETTAPARPRHNRVISPEVAAQLSAATPKYTPPPPKPPPAEEEEDLRDIDKPKNGIIRLPKYVVREPAPPVLSERAVNTKKGLADIAMRKYFTQADRALNAFTVPLFGSSAEDRALAMYAEDERLKNMADLNDAARMTSATDKSAGTYIKRAATETYMRPGDFDWKPMGR